MIVLLGTIVVLTLLWLANEFDKAMDTCGQIDLGAGMADCLPDLEMESRLERFNRVMARVQASVHNVEYPELFSRPVQDRHPHLAHKYGETCIYRSYEPNTAAALHFARTTESLNKVSKINSYRRKYGRINARPTRSCRLIRAVAKQ